MVINMKQLNENKETEQSKPCPLYGRVGKVENDKNEMPVIVLCLIVLFFMAGAYAIYDIFIKDINSIEKQTLFTVTDELENQDLDQMADVSGVINSDIVECQNDSSIKIKECQEMQSQIIGKWYDKGDPSFFYMLYKSDGKIYLNFSDVKTIQCVLHKIKGNEYVFRNEGKRIFNLKPGTSVYIGKGLEEKKSYRSNVILLQQNNHLIVYMNDIDIRIYDKQCVATK